jgi:serine phosphatase RsbU (regulator of sigma subunit)
MRGLPDRVFKVPRRLRQSRLSKQFSAYLRCAEESVLGRLLISDGIVEATDPNGNLFGFDRVYDLLRSATNAVEIANAVQAFGQEDDIRVISVTRTAVREPVAA